MERLTPQHACEALLLRIQALILQKGHVLAAIDGMASSGKTTLAAALAEAIPGCHVVHVDDFFLPAQRRADVRARLTANADLERLDADVLAPLCAGKDALFRPFRCHPEPAFLPPVRIPADFQAVIVEGAYSLHPLLADRYDLGVVMTIGADTQRARIRARNGEAMLARFENEWIPLENRHIRVHRLLERCDVRIDVP